MLPKNAKIFLDYFSTIFLQLFSSLCIIINLHQISLKVTEKVKSLFSLYIYKKKEICIIVAKKAKTFPIFLINLLIIFLEFIQNSATKHDFRRKISRRKLFFIKFYLSHWRKVNSISTVYQKNTCINIAKKLENIFAFFTNFPQLFSSLCRILSKRSISEGCRQRQ